MDENTKKDLLQKAGQVKTTKEQTEPQGAQTTSGLTQTLTGEEQAIFSRVMAESNKEWATIDPHATLDYSLAEDPFKLPEPARKLEEEKKFKFRWFTRTAQRVDEIKNRAVPMRWWPVNRTQPVGKVFDNHVDGTTGGVHLLDQLLFFKPWWMWEKEKEIKTRLADSYGSITSKDGQEINDLRLSASKRRQGEREDKRSRAEITGSDVQFKGEAEVDAEMGRTTSYASESDLVVNE